MLLGESDQILVKIQRRHGGRGISWIADDNAYRLWDRVFDRTLQRLEELGRRIGGRRADDAARHQEAEGVDRIGRIGNQDHVARRGDGLRHVCEALLGAQSSDDLRVRVQRDAEAALIIIGLGAPQSGDPLGSGVTIGARAPRRLDQLVDHMFGRGQVGIAHAEVDDVGAAGARLGLEPVYLLEDIGRQALDAIKVRHSGVRWVKKLWFPPSRAFSGV